MYTEKYAEVNEKFVKPISRGSNFEGDGCPTKESHVQ